LPLAPAFGDPRSEACRERVFAGLLAEGMRDLPPARHTELLAKDVAMRFRRPWRDAKPLSNFFVGAARCDQLDDLPLSPSENRRALLHDRRHGRDANNGVPACLLT
jgi:hypothetical protein